MEKTAVRCRTKEEWITVLNRIGISPDKYPTNGESCVCVDGSGHASAEYQKITGYTIISAEEYLKEGEEFKVGDRVRWKKDGLEYKIYYRAGTNNSIKRNADKEDQVTHGAIRDIELELLTNKTTNKEEAMSKSNDVNKAVQKVFGDKKYTGEQMLLVDKHLGGEIKTDTLSIMLLEDKADKILSIAEDMEKEELAAAKKD